ncbi:unnamed protein product [Darwinula stevensoni]|uniref:Kazal-like domain-containing protein n=1 Tax=Darwinula stevensoni TaxID=69355 RepID=A0A7R9AB82_9CRUS|nr:unnamed protein product [Darwinula stevensoni]CAG0899039.1 unnamed protein product [Darwinula stevensoni]
MDGESAAIPALCGRLPSHADGCLPVSAFLTASPLPYVPPDEQATSPCRKNPCSPSQVCVPTRRCRHGLPESHCPTYTCVPGCVLGEVSSFTVEAGTWVRIPQATPVGKKAWDAGKAWDIGRRQSECERVCQCGADGALRRCGAVECRSLGPCWLGNARIQHGETVNVDCQKCMCHYGDLVCGRRRCPRASPVTSVDAQRPCDCPSERTPVCGRNGVTYPNSCHALIAVSRGEAPEGNPFTAREVARRLSSLVQVAQCEVTAYVWTRGEVVAVVSPGRARASRVQASACKEEARKIASAIELRGPQVLSDAVLGTLTVAEAVPPWSSAGRRVADPRVALVLSVLWCLRRL